MSSSETPRITDAIPTRDGVTVSLGANHKFFSWLWLRDHAQDPASYHPASRQRLLETFELGQPGCAELSIEDAGQTLTLQWPGMTHAVRYTASYLSTVDAPAPLYDVLGGDQQSWGGQQAAERVREFSHDAVIKEDATLRAMLETIRRSGFVVLHDVPREMAAARRVMERIGYLRASIFGDLWEFRADGKFDDTASTPLAIKPHTDGTYNHDAPGVLALLCLQYRARGGDNLLVDGLHIAQRMREQHPEAYRTLCQIPIPGQYIGDGAYLVAQRPLFRTDDNGRVVQISYNNHDRAPFHLPAEQMDALYHSLGLFDRMISDPANQLVLGLRPGDMLIFDNWRLLHGRTAFEGERHMAGCYLNREDLESRLRMLSAQPLNMLREPPIPSD